MTITIPCDMDGERDVPLVLRSDLIDNDNFVALSVRADGPDLFVPVSDLLAAVTAFADLRRTRLEDEALLK